MEQSEVKLSRSERYRATREANKAKSKMLGSLEGSTDSKFDEALAVVNDISVDEVSSAADTSVLSAESLNETQITADMAVENSEAILTTHSFQKVLSERCGGSKSQFERELAHRQGRAKEPVRDFKSEIAFRRAMR